LDLPEKVKSLDITARIWDRRRLFQMKVASDVQDRTARPDDCGARPAER